MPALGGQPDPDLDLGEHLLELALRHAVGPAVGVRSERRLPALT